MPSLESDAFKADNSPHTLVGRIVELRRQLGIDAPLSLDDPREAVSAGSDPRRWLAWSQSKGGGGKPGGGNPPGK